MPINITIPSVELYDSEKNEFYDTKECTITLEHSLLSISKWESKWHKSFFTTFNGKETKSRDELVDYIKCMTLTKNVDYRVYHALSAKTIKNIWDYVNDPMTATWFSETNRKKTSRDTVTSELIYYWMIASNIPFEPCQKWHVNRLLALIEVCSRKNAPAKKMSRKAIMEQNRALNAQRRMKNHSKG